MEERQLNTYNTPFCTNQPEGPMEQLFGNRLFYPCIGPCESKGNSTTIDIGAMSAKSDGSESDSDRPHASKSFVSLY